MKLNQIIDFASQQKKHFVEYDTTLKEISYDKDNWIILTNDEMEFRMTSFAKKMMDEYLKLLGTASDFENDFEFMQKAYERKLTSRNQKNGVKIIYDDRNQNAYGIKTGRYQKIYNLDLLEILSTCNEYSLNEKFSYIDNERMILNYNNVEKTTKLDVGTFIHGITIYNSEIGAMRLGVLSSLNRVECSNGMTSNVSNSLTMVPHVGKELEFKFQEMLMNTEKEKTLLDAISKSSLKKLKFDEENTLSDYLTQHRIPIKYHSKIQEQLDQEYLGDNSFNIYNAMTRYVSHEIQIGYMQQQMMLLANNLL